MRTDGHTDNLLKDGEYWIERTHLHLSREAGERGVVVGPQRQQAGCHGDPDSGSNQEAVA